jgi:nucleoside-diphosphate-sugar epimerase
MRILVTGNLGYTGVVLTRMLADRGYDVVGYDTDYYEGSELYEFDGPSRQIRKDIRDVAPADVRGIQAVVHLAALSNDPLGQFNAALTEEINRDATLKLARLAKAAGAERFVYASSQSMYGISRTDEELDEDNSVKNPLTAYAQTKWRAECGLKTLHDEDFTVVCMRPSTIFGASPRLRCDIVFNNLVACAYTTGRIEVKSDGTPRRPVVHVQDACQAYVAALEAPAQIVGGRSFNVGIPDGNFTVRALAEAAQQCVPGSELVFTGEHGRDARTYRVSFKRILTELKDYYRPTWDLVRGGTELVRMFDRVGFSAEDFRGWKCTRLAALERQLAAGRIGKDFRRLRQKEKAAG